jgi:hypothetical protein
MHTLVEWHGLPGWVAALTLLSVDGMIMAESTTLLADSRAGERGGVLPWTLLVEGSAASLAANVAVAQPTVAGRVIAAWPSFALIGAYELLMRRIRRSAAVRGGLQAQSPDRRFPARSLALRTHGARPYASPGRAAARKAQPRLVVWAGSFSGRRGSGHWLTGRVMARFPAEVRSPLSWSA